VVLLAPDLACVAVRPAALRALVAVALAPLLAAVCALAELALVRLPTDGDFELVDGDRFAGGMLAPD
jgi:hypothetical protein